ncbi:MAG TPA: glucose 1-dehydrogenase [Longimicrobiales bacterium]
MRALTVRPGEPGSLRIDDVEPPRPRPDQILVRARALGVCGTDREIVDGEYGTAPAGRERLILGHESLGTVESAPAGSGFAPGDTVVGIVRHPDPVPCSSCAVGEWDMCRNGDYTEHGIKERDGFGAELYALDVDHAVRVDPDLGITAVLLEPASVLAKAWDHIERIGQRAAWNPERVLVTGAGPVGLLAALLGVQRGLDVHVFDHAQGGPKPELVRDLGGTFHNGTVEEIGVLPDIVLECTGVPALVVDVMGRNAPAGIVCLAGLSPGLRTIGVDVAGLNRSMVLENDVIFGSVNANRRHYELAAGALAAADRGWLERLITRRLPLERFADALEKVKGDVKTVIDFAA